MITITITITITMKVKKSGYKEILSISSNGANQRA